MFNNFPFIFVGLFATTGTQGVYMKKFMILLLTLSFQVMAGGGRDLPTADYVDIERYLGKWYAISSLPQFFTRNCIGQTADYDAINPQTISVVNTCLKKKGSSVIRGQAVVKNASTNAELIVTFNSFFTRLFRVKGDYTIVKLDPEYRYVLVGDKKRKSMWVLSRTKTMPEVDYQEYVNYAKELDFPVENLVLSTF
jgi:apolipoprotein D and lipocalin family protein